uniref:Uncharacterized protein n=1 Tax=Plectus sambesii TaxID=2011161 RepID=A0A914XE55_9BILA
MLNCSMAFIHLALLAVAAIAVYGKPLEANQKDAPQCDIPWATYCLKSYMDQFGFNSTSTGVFPDPNSFNLALSNYISANGLNGLANTNTWWLALQTCLGPNSYPCIFDSEKLQQIFNTDSTSEDSTLWLITFVEEDFTNTPTAYAVYRQYYHCSVQVQTHYASAISQCQSTYFNDIAKDPSNICSYQVFFMSCLQTVYASNCSPKLGGFVCAELSIYLRITNPGCVDNPPAGNICYSMT